MKLLLPLACIAFLTTTAFGQIPNANFEEWIVTDFYEDPVGWTTDNSEQAQTVFRDEEAYEGNYAMRVVAQPTGVGSYGEAKTTVTIGALPTSLEFFVRTFQENGTGLAGLSFYVNEEPVGSNFWFGFQSLNEWTAVSVPFLQNPAITHVEIIAIAEVGDFAEGEAWIAIDQMSFSIPTSTRASAGGLPFNLYPNPAVGEVRIDMGGLERGRVELTDLTGKMVMAADVNPVESVIAVASLSPGIYLATLFDRAGQRQGTVKLVKQAQH